MANNNIIEKTNNLDKTIPVDPIGYLYTNETQAHQFIISCTRKGEKVRLTGSVTARFVTSQNTYFVVHGSIVDGNAVITLHQDCYSIPGHFDLAIFVTSGTVTTVVYAAVGTVKRTDSEEGVITGEPLPTLDELLAVVRDAQQIVSDFDDIILVQDTQPTSETNRIWVQPQADEYQVPTLEEHEALEQEVEDLKSQTVHNDGIGEVTRANCDFYTITGTNLVKTQNRKLVEGEYWSTSKGGYYKRDGWSCIKDISVVPGATYYFLAQGALEFDSNGEMLRYNTGNQAGARSFTALDNTEYVVLNYDGVPSGNIGGEKYILTTHNGTQSYAVQDEELTLVDGNFSGYSKNYTQVLALAQQADELSSENKEKKVSKSAIAEVTRANCDFYTITGTNLIKTQNRKITENTIWSVSQNGYVDYPGRFCIKDIQVVPGTTYYYIATNAIEFDANGVFLVNNSGNLGASRSFTATANTAYVVLNYNSEPTGNIGGETYVLTTYNGTQTPVKIKDPDLLLQDSNFAEYGIEFSKIAQKTLSPLKCGIMNEYGTTIDINDCTITATNVEVLDTGKSKFSRGSKMVRVTKTAGVTDYNIVITLPRTISANRWWVTMMLTAETENATTGSYAGLRINNLTNNVRATNGYTTENTWCFLGPHHGSAQSISSIKLVFTPRSGINDGDVCGVYWIDSITFNAKMKPTFILNFDQWWQDSIDNGGYQYCFENNVPFTMMTKNYDSLSATFKALAHKAETYGCENSYYASYGSSNTSLLNASAYTTAVTEVANTQNDFVNEFGKKYISYGCTQMKLNQFDREALLADGVKMIRGKASDAIDYFDADCWWTPSVSISSDTKTLAQVKTLIDNVISYGGCLLAFTHGICADDATVMDGSSSNGMKISDFKAMIDYLVAKRTTGDIQICTMRDWYNQCAS